MISFTFERSDAYPKRSASAYKQNNDLKKKKRPNAIEKKKKSILVVSTS